VVEKIKNLQSCHYFTSFKFLMCDLILNKGWRISHFPQCLVTDFLRGPKAAMAGIIVSQVASGA
jgi:hypothetical protein